MSPISLFGIVWALLVPAALIAALLLLERVVRHWIRILDDKTRRSRLRYAAAMSEGGES